MYVRICIAGLFFVAGLAVGCKQETASPVNAPQSAAPDAAAGGQQSQAGNDPATKKGAASLETADSVLKSMARAYREAASYQDAAEGTLIIELAPGAPGAAASVDGKPPEPIQQKFGFSAAFERPNKLRLQNYEAGIVCDGKQLRAQIKQLPNQVLSIEAPANFTMEEIYKDEVLNSGLMGVAGSSVQMLLLLEDKALEAMFTGIQPPELLPPETIDERPCYKVKTVREDGDMILWVDKQTFELRRLQLPTKPLLAQLSQDINAKRVEVRIDFLGAKLNAKIDPEAFVVKLPPEVELVAKFDPKTLNPPPPPPSQLLGQAVPEFTATALDGKLVSPAELKGQVTVLDFWFIGCPPCRQSLPLLETVYQRYKDNPKVRFLAVSVDPREKTDDELRATFAELKVNVPIARDPDSKTAETLGINGFPTMVLLGADGRIQELEPGFNPNLAEILPAKLDKLLAGEDLYKTAMADYERRLAEYNRGLKEPQAPKAVIAAKSEPAVLKLTKLWENEEIDKPGNILVVPKEGGEPSIIVNSGWRTVVQLGADGKIVAKHELQIPEEDVVSTLRTGVDKQGRRFYVGFANSQRQLHLFDEEWMRTLSFPADREHAGVADVEIADFQGDGRPQLAVSYWGVVGVQAVTLGGERLWSNRAAEDVFRLAVVGPDPSGKQSLLAANRSGKLLPIDGEGNEGKPVQVGDRFITHVVAADLDGDGRTEVLAFSPTVDGPINAVGMSPSGQELWSYPLPAGVQEFPIEMVTTGAVLPGKAKQWVLAGSDGSIHVIGVDGQGIDRFNYGIPLSGIAVAQLGGQPVLLVATGKKIEAWGVGK